MKLNYSPLLLITLNERLWIDDTRPRLYYLLINKKKSFINAIVRIQITYCSL